MGYNKPKENNYMLRFKIQLGVFIVAALLFSLICQPAYAEKKSSSNKLLAIVITITKGSPKKGWNSPNDEYAKITYKNVKKFLTASGIYELAPIERIEAIKKERKIQDKDWEKNNWEILKSVGKELGADYAFVSERGFAWDIYFSMVIINMNTGKIFEHYDYKPDSYPGAFNDIIKKSYREIFRLAKSDLITTAMMKVQGKVLHPKDKPKKTTEDKKPVETPKIEGKEIKEKEPHVAGQEPAKPPEEKKLSAENKDVKTALIVYDFNTSEHLRVIALLLAEALREELSSRFRIIAREETLKAADEMKLQQSGFVDEKYMMSVGKWLSAKEAVSGTFGVIGKTYMLQAKRINMETLEMLSSGSIKVSVDKEEELLNGLSSIAVNLSESR